MDNSRKKRRSRYEIRPLSVRMEHRLRLELSRCDIRENRNGLRDPSDDLRQLDGNHPIKIQNESGPANAALSDFCLLASIGSGLTSQGGRSAHAGVRASDRGGIISDVLATGTGRSREVGLDVGGFFGNLEYNARGEDER